MIPILYSEQETNFNHNGIAALFDTISCNVSEERNGLFEVQLIYPSGGMWVKELIESRFISAKPNDEDESHLFRIYEITKSLEEETITVYGATKTNDLGANLVQEVVITDSTVQQALDTMKANLLDPTSINFYSDIETLHSTKWKHQNPLNCIAGVEGSVISIWGGEIKRTNDTIYLYGRRGTDRVTTIRQGKNIAGFSQTNSLKGLITSILPFVEYTPKDATEPVTIRGTVVNSPLMSNYPVRYIFPVDYSSDNALFPEEVEGMTQEEYDALILSNINTKAQTYFSYQYPGCDKPKVTIEIDMMQLSDSSEYQKFRKLEHISLTDTVDVWIAKFNVDTTVKINKIEYDSLGEKVTKITAGSERNTLYQDIGKTYQDNIDKVKEYVDTVENGIYNTIRISADGKNNIFSGYTTPDPSLVKTNDIWYKPVADGEIEMYRWNGEWLLAVGNADKLIIGSIDANVVNLVNLNADNLATGTITGANGAWNLNTGEFWLGSSRAEAYLLWDGTGLVIRTASTWDVGIVSINGDGVTVGEVGSTKTSTLNLDGVYVADNGKLIAVFGDSAIIPFFEADDFDCPNIAGVINSATTYQVGTGYAYSSINYILQTVLKGRKILNGVSIVFEVYDTLNEIISIKGYTGTGSIVIRLMNGAIINGNITAEDNSVKTFLQCVNGVGFVKRTTTEPVIINNCYMNIFSINIDCGPNGGAGILGSNGAVVKCHNVDIANANWCIIMTDGSTGRLRDTRGNALANGLVAQNGSVIHTWGTSPNAPPYEDYGTIHGTLVPTASTFNVPPVTSKTYTQIFGHTQMATWVHGSTSVDSYYGAAAAQNRWDSSMGWKDGIAKFGAEPYNFFNGGSNIIVRIRLRRKNSTHGSSGGVVPAPNNYAATGFNAVLRGEWSAWATITNPTALFGSGGVNLKHYNGVSGASGYAIWDAAQVEVTVTKTI